MVEADCLIQNQEAVFILRNLDPIYREAALDLAFTPDGSNFIRTFPAASPGMERIGEHFRQSAQDLLLQTARRQAVPWQSALRLWLARLEGRNVHWFLCGSTALAVRGVEAAPRDIDLVTDDAGAHQLGEIFADALIEPVVPAQEWIWNWFGRAFLTARFEWVGGVNERADAPEISDFGLVAARRLETVMWQGYTLLVPPLELQLAVSKRRNLSERVAAIEKYQAAQG